jgi:hypothetical protein
MRRDYRLGAVVLSGLLSCGGIASAQQKPMVQQTLVPATTPVPQQTSLPQQTPAPQQQTVHHPRTIIDLVGTYNTMASSDSFGGSAADPPMHDFRLSGRLTQLVGSRLQLYYFDNNDAANATLGRVTNAQGAYTYPQPSRQDSFEIGGHYVTSTHTYVQAAYFYRWQVCCPATAGPTNLAPTNTERLYYLEAGYYTSPIWHTGIVASYAVHGVLDPHHLVTPAYLASLPPGESDHVRSITGLYQQFGLSAPIDRAGKVKAFGIFINGAVDYFDNSLAPYYYDFFIYGLAYHPTKRFTLTANINILTQQNLSGYPFVYSNAIHRSIFIMTGDFTIPL